METESNYRTPTYGNFRRPMSAGLGALGTLGTVILMAGLVAVVVAIAFGGLPAALVTAAVVAAAILLLSVRDRHRRSLLQKLVTAIQFLGTVLSGSRIYRSGPTGWSQLGTHQLPGLLSASMLFEGSDSYGRPFALLHLPATGHFTIVISVDPQGAALVDDEQVDAWVSLWAQWLATLAHEPNLVAASVSVETAPDSGSRLRQETELTRDAEAPAVALEALDEILRSYPTESTTLTASIALTFAARRRSTNDVIRELASRLAGLTATLSATGVGVARPMSAQQLCELVRGAYDPAASMVFDAAHALGDDIKLAWSDVGPVAHEVGWDCYRHDGATSITWQMSGPPRGEVFSSVLAGLLGPHRDIDRKRVTLLYRPFDPTRAAQTVEADRRSADFRVSSTPRPSARALDEQRSATAIADDEARGAGLVNFGLIVTATVADERHRAAAEAAIGSLSASARILLRKAYGSQETAFVSGLPVGVVLPLHLVRPAFAGRRTT